jgi:hypothetical protein
VRQGVRDVVGVVRAVTSVIGDAVGVVGDVAGVSEARASVVITDVGVGEVVDADWICVPSVVEVTKSLKPVVHVIWPIVNVRPAAVAMESGKMTISHA